MKRALALLCAAVSGLACSEQDGLSSADDGGTCRLALTQVAAGLSQPVFVSSPPGDSRLFVVEQGGTIRIVDEGGLRNEPFLDVSGSIVAGNEQGLLGLAFHPRYAETGRLWIHYTVVD